MKVRFFTTSCFPLALLLQTQFLPFLAFGFSISRHHKIRSYHPNYHSSQRPKFRSVYPTLDKASQQLSFSLSHDGPSNSRDESKSDFGSLAVAGASVSPLGFLVLAKSSYTYDRQQLDIAFPIQLTSSGTSTASNDNTDKAISRKMTIPSLFQENIDQTSVTTPEALTFLQLLNGVDMATPILPPDTLSLICIWYAFLLDRGAGGDTGALQIEDELGLDSNASTDPAEFQRALDYIRHMVETTLPPSSPGVSSNNMLASSQWKRSRVVLPSVRLHGVRVEGAETSIPTKQKEQQYEFNIKTVPLKFVLECSVDDGSKRLEIPLFAIPDRYDQNPLEAREPFEISNEVLRELSHSFNGGTSASFVSLSLWNRYKKSSGGDRYGDAPTLKVSHRLLNQLSYLQQEAESSRKEGGAGAIRYCWVAPQTLDSENRNTKLDTLIQSAGLQMYRPLSELKKPDQRILQHLKEQSFGKSSTSSRGDDTMSKSVVVSGTSKQNQKALTLEQQAIQQRLKSAWKVATEKNDSEALKKIQKAMHDFEKQLDLKSDEEEPKKSDDNDDSSLQKIRRAMKADETDNDDEVVSLITELEEAMDESDFDTD
ncbi:hypothetical protein HJC23_012013 [Cyclotella cryptica]|uniref:Uncharacterized protein n=1 Tax=Cyclotella cryptica TaxID=29204 RepID=A0ABD3QQK6_9STRA|eukprot:CCRYP_003070-RA/>CCRYP_003070-RA protein AED:0.08 eAED:-0.09 QI:0/-1/0/1/-1/1/1/0/596